MLPCVQVVRHVENESEANLVACWLLDARDQTTLLCLEYLGKDNKKGRLYEKLCRGLHGRTCDQYQQRGGN
jgi:hypothetical protein